MKQKRMVSCIGSGALLLVTASLAPMTLRDAEAFATAVIADHATRATVLETLRSFADSNGNIDDATANSIINSVPIAPAPAQVQVQNDDQLNADLKNLIRDIDIAESFSPQPAPRCDYLVTKSQRDSWSCGPRSIGHMHAINALVQAKEAITSESVQKAAEKSIDKILVISGYQGQELTESTMRTLCLRYGIKDYSLMSLQADKTPYLPYSRDEERELQSIKKRFQEQETHVHHFLCHSGDHWIVISVVKTDENGPKLYLMNSKNSPLTQESYAYQFVSYLSDVFLN